MFTTLQITKAISEATNGQELYSLAKNEVSYLLSTLGSWTLGTAVEVAVADRLYRCGIDCEHLGGPGQDDVVAYIKGRRRVLECKSSKLGPKSEIYTFTGIDPSQFDTLLLAFGHPTEGLVIKSASSADVKAWGLNGPKGKERKWQVDHNGNGGYEMSTQAHGVMSVKGLNLIEWNPEGLTMVKSIA